VFHLKNKI